MISNTNVHHYNMVGQELAHLGGKAAEESKRVVHRVVGTDG